MPVPRDCTAPQREARLRDAGRRGGTALPASPAVYLPSAATSEAFWGQHAVLASLGPCTARGTEATNAPSTGPLGCP